jgi:effector-binding domain-containing protein
MIPTVGIASRMTHAQTFAMNPLASELSFLLCACAATLSAFVPCAAAPAQAQAAAEVEALLAKIEAVRGRPGQAPAGLAIEGTFAVTFAGSPSSEPVAQGKFREVFAGAERARHTSDMGEFGKMERGVTEQLAWELDPSMGPKVFTGAQAAVVRRSFAVQRGASPRELYAKIERTGVHDIDGREHVVLRMIPAQGKPDTWYVDAATGTLARIDTMLPAPESADATWDMSDWIEAHLTFSDWKTVGAVQFPHRRTLAMGPATVTNVCSKIDAGAQIESASFTPPDAVHKVKDKPSPKITDADGKPVYQLVERESQSVASIRTKCKPSEISATLAELLPEVMAHLNATGAKMAGAPFSRYHAFGPEMIDLEAGIPVSQPITENGRVKNSELPAGKAVTVWHIGPYEKLTGAHEGLQAYLAANKLTASGGPWELYWTDPGLVPDPAKWRTQLFVAVQQ